MLDDLKLVLKQLDLLFVDDNINVAAGAYALFASMFNSVTLAHDFETAEQLLKEGKYDLLMTDINLPDNDGLTLVEKIRQTDQELPIVIVSAYDDKAYLLRAANLRIDGYIIKPLNFNKLIPILTAIVERIKHKLQDFQLQEKVFFNVTKSELTVDGSNIRLGKKEEKLLRLLLANEAKVVPKSVIRDEIWPEGDMTPPALKNLFSALRKKLKYDVINTIPSKGWMIKSRTLDAV